MQPGNIYFHEKFVFRDGGQANKYLVVLGASATHLVVAKTTTTRRTERNDFGCQSANRFPVFYLPQGCCCMRECTWICLDELYELEISVLNQRIATNQVTWFGEITNLTRDIQFCAISCEDITPHQEGIIRSSLAPA